MEATCSIPTTFKLGAMEEEIKYEAGLFHNFRLWSMGLSSTGEIRISEALPLTLQKEHIFMQLLMWCGDVVEGVDVNGAEQAIVSRQLFSLIRNNPKLIDLTEPIWGIKSIRVLTKCYKIYSRPAIIDCLATLEAGLLLIDVTEEAKLDLQWLSLWHEIFHLVRLHVGQDVRGHGGEESEEERIVDGFAYMFCTLLESNDMTWLLESKDEALDVYPATSRSLKT